MISAVAPQIGELTRANQATKEAIYNSVPAGAARDIAMAQNERELPAQKATLLNTAYTGALDKLANVGSGLGAFSLQELSAGLKAGELSGSTRNQVMQRDSEAKAATLGFLGSLAGAGGQIAGAKMK
jgi:hypothetical protein